MTIATMNSLLMGRVDSDFKTTFVKFVYDVRNEGQMRAETEGC